MSERNRNTIFYHIQCCLSIGPQIIFFGFSYATKAALEKDKAIKILHETNQNLLAAVKEKDEKIGRYISKMNKLMMMSGVWENPQPRKLHKNLVKMRQQDQRIWPIGGVLGLQDF